jgi:hypothetical protein
MRECLTNEINESEVSVFWRRPRAIERLINQMVGINEWYDLELRDVKSEEQP